MHTILPLALVILISVTLIVIGIFYISTPEQVVGSFGLNLPSADPDTRAWLGLKGIRDVACGSAVLILLLTTNLRRSGFSF